MISQLFLVATQTINNHPFQRVTDGAVGIQHLFIWFLIAATFVFVAVIGFMVYSMIKYRHRGEGMIGSHRKRILISKWKLP